jgi:hypothetical protein
MIYGKYYYFFHAFPHSLVIQLFIMHPRKATLKWSSYWCSLTLTWMLKIMWVLNHLTSTVKNKYPGNLEISTSWNVGFVAHEATKMKITNIFQPYKRMTTFLWYEIFKQETWQSLRCMYIDVTILDLQQCLSLSVSISTSEMDFPTQKFQYNRIV